MMRYVKLEDNDLNLYGVKSFYADATKLFLEINPNNGEVEKEIVLNAEDQIIHRCPSEEKKFKYGKYGIFDLATFDLSSFKSNIDKLTFYALWRME